MRQYVYIVDRPLSLKEGLKKKVVIICKSIKRRKNLVCFGLLFCVTPTSPALSHTHILLVSPGRQ